MDFFVPEADDEAEAEEVWHATKNWVEKKRDQVTERRIYSIEYADPDTQRTHAVAVGDDVPGVGEPAQVILESATGTVDVYYLCSPNRGVLGGSPVMVEKQHVQRVEEFE